MSKVNPHLIGLQKLLVNGKLDAKEVIRVCDRVIGSKPVASANLIVPATHDAWKTVRPKDVMIEDLLLKGGRHVFAGLFETYKTMFALALSKVFRTAPPMAFNERGCGFKVHLEKPVEVVFLCPDMDASLFHYYAAQFGLMNDPGFYTLHPSEDDVTLGIDSPELIQLAKGRVLVFDTMWDYARLEDAHQSGEWIVWFGKLRRLVKVHGAVGTILLAHPTKAGAEASDIDATKFLKDSVTFGGKIDVGLAFRPVDNTSEIVVKRIKGRGFKQKDFAFSLTIRDEDGNSYLDKGEFPVLGT
jgi:hypothetical protein